MKKVIKNGVPLSKKDINELINENWWRSIYDGKFCMENSKTILLAPKLNFKVVTFQSKANDLIL